MTFEIYINGVKVKEYPYRLQAETYLHMRGYVSDGGRLGKFLNENVEIKVKEEKWQITN